MSYITKLRQKPKHVRDNIAFVAAGLSVVPVAAFLLLGVHGPNLTNGIADSDENGTKFFETFTSQIREQVASVREATSSSTSEANVVPTVIDRGPLDAVPVMPPATSTGNNRTALTSTTTIDTSTSNPTTTR